MLKLLQTNFEHYEKSTTKSSEDELFRPKILDYVRLLIHLYDIWPQQQKGDIFNKENEFFWTCLDVYFTPYFIIKIIERTSCG